MATGCMAAGLLLLALLDVGAAGADPVGPHGPTAPTVPAPGGAGDRYIVVFSEEVHRAGRETREREREVGIEAERVFRSALEGFSAELTRGQLQELRHDPEVAFVDRDGRVTALEASASAQAPLAPGEPVPPNGIRRIGAATGSTAGEPSDAGVAVLDTGVDLDHPDLNVADGTNCASPGAPAIDRNGHGTHVSGTIAARNDGAGVVGVAPGTLIHAVKVLNDSGSGSWSSVACGLDWVAANADDLDIGVINMSLGGTSGSPLRSCDRTTDALHLAICRVTDAGVNVVVAAGNEGRSFDGGWVQAPAAYPEVLTVTAINDTDGLPGGLGGLCAGGDDTPAWFSNWAAGEEAQAHTIAAPGTCVDSTLPNGGYGRASGTSMASPHMAGLVALCLDDGGTRGRCAGRDPAEVIEVMRERAAALTAADPGYGFAGDPDHDPVAGRYYGYLAATPAFLRLDWIPETRITGDGAEVTADSTPTFEFEADKPGVAFECRFDQQPFTACSGPGARHTATAPLADGTHEFAVRARDAEGAADATPASRAFTVDTVEPRTEIVSQPSDPTADATPYFSFNSSEAGARFECRFDGAAFGPCRYPTAHRPLVPLGDGTRVFEVRAVDRAGNADSAPERRVFTVDTVAPETSIELGPESGGAVLSGIQRFRLLASEAGSLECSVNGEPWRSCGPGVRLDLRTPGAYRFSARAVDGTGNADPTPAERRFRVVAAPRGCGFELAAVELGGPEPEALRGDGGADLLIGGGGDDRLHGAGAGDCMLGGGGSDRILAGAGRDRLDGGRGSDRLRGGRGRDVLRGGAGADSFKCGRGRDELLDASAEDRWARDCEVVVH